MIIGKTRFRRLIRYGLLLLAVSIRIVADYGLQTC